MHYAYSWADGKIGFGKKIPNGALEIAKHKNQSRLKNIVKLHASDNGLFIVGVRLAFLGVIDSDPIECLIAFGDYINSLLNNRSKGG